MSENTTTATLRGRGKDTRGVTGAAQLGTGWRARGLLQPGLVGSSFSVLFAMVGFSEANYFHFIFPFASSCLLLVLSVNVVACLRQCCASQHKQ